MNETTAFKLTYLAVVLAGSSLIVSISTFDWMWAIVSGACFLALLLPRIITKEQCTYHYAIMCLIVIPFTLYLILSISNWFLHIEIYRYLSLMIQPLATLSTAYLFLINLDVNSDIVLSKRWLMVFSVTAACMFSVLYLFFLFVYMQDLGLPLYNEDFYGENPLDNTPSNKYLMLPMNMAVVFSFIYGLILDLSIKGIDKTEITRYYCKEASNES